MPLFPSLSVMADGVPGAELVEAGLDDLRAGRETVEACLATIALPWLYRTRCLPRDEFVTPLLEPERALYRLLCAKPGDAYGRYNSLLRRLVSFERELARRALRREPSHVRPVTLSL